MPDDWKDKHWSQFPTALIEEMLRIRQKINEELSVNQEYALQWILAGFLRRPELHLELESLKRAHEIQKPVLDAAGIVFVESDIDIVWDFALNNKLINKGDPWPDEIETPEDWKL